MAKLSNFKQDSAAIEGGEWVELPEWDGLKIKTRGFTNQYKDSIALRRRRAASGFGGDEGKLPAAVVRGLLVEAMIAHLLLDVANLEGANGEPVAFEQFCALLRDPDYEQLGLACIEAASQVGKRRAADIEEAAAPLASS